VNGISTYTSVEVNIIMAGDTPQLVKDKLEEETT
jgi:hypothetical protein